MTEERRCFTCRHERLSTSDSPCRACFALDSYPHWQARPQQTPVEAADAVDAARYRTLKKNAATDLHSWVRAFYDAQRAGSLDVLLDRVILEGARIVDEEVDG